MLGAQVTRCKSETIISVNRECRICTPCASCFAKHPHLCRVHIHSMCHDFLRVPPLRRVTCAPSMGAILEVKVLS